MARLSPTSCMCCAGCASVQGQDTLSVVDRALGLSVDDVESLISQLERLVPKSIHTITHTLQ